MSIILINKKLNSEFATDIFHFGILYIQGWNKICHVSAKLTIQKEGPKKEDSM